MDDPDLTADLTPRTTTALGWLTLTNAHAPELMRSGAMLAARNVQTEAVVRVVTTDDDGQVHFSTMPGPVARNRHLLD